MPTPQAPPMVHKSGRPDPWGETVGPMGWRVSMQQVIASDRYTIAGEKVRPTYTKDDGSAHPMELGMCLQGKSDLASA